MPGFNCNLTGFTSNKMIALVFACMVAVAYSASTMGPTTDAATTMAASTMAASTMAASTMAASTMAASTAGPAVTKILYDLKHMASIVNLKAFERESNYDKHYFSYACKGLTHKAIIVRTDGCYEYHMNHQDLEMAKDDNLKHLLEQKMTDALNAATAIHEMGHHHIDHMSSEITTACASVPVYAFH